MGLYRFVRVSLSRCFTGRGRQDAGQRDAGGTRCDDTTYCNTTDGTKMSPFPRGAKNLFELLSSFLLL